MALDKKQTLHAAPRCAHAPYPNATLLAAFASPERRRQPAVHSDVSSQHPLPQPKTAVVATTSRCPRLLPSATASGNCLPLSSPLSHISRVSCACPLLRAAATACCCCQLQKQCGCGTSSQATLPAQATGQRVLTSYTEILPAPTLLRCAFPRRVLRNSGPPWSKSGVGAQRCFRGRWVVADGRWWWWVVDSGQ